MRKWSRAGRVRPREGALDALVPMLLVTPVLVGAGYTAAASLGIVGVGGGGTADWGRLYAVLTDPAVVHGTLWTLWIAGASTTLAALAGVVLAVVFRRAALLDRFARALSAVPLPVPHLVAGLAALLILGQSGLLARIAYHAGWIAGPSEMLPLVYDRAGVGVIAALVWKEIPFLALVAGSVLATRGDALERAAAELGADRATIFRRITWPLLWRGVLPAAVAVFTFAAGSYEVPVLLAPSEPMALPVQLWERSIDADLSRRPEAYALALLGLAIALAAVALHEGVQRWTR